MTLTDLRFVRWKFGCPCAVVSGVGCVLIASSVDRIFWFLRALGSTFICGLAVLHLLTVNLQVTVSDQWISISLAS